MPDVFNGDAVTPAMQASGFNATEWGSRHPTEVSDRIAAQTIDYMRRDFGVERIGAVGYCWGGKYVPRMLAQGGNINAGFIAHPSLLTTAEIEAVVGPLSLAVGSE